MRVFELLVHVEATPEQPLDGALGAYLVCYVPAKAIAEATVQAERWLAELGFRAPSTTQAILIDLDEWRPPTTKHPNRDALRNALETESPLIGPVHSYEAEHEH